MNFTHTHTQRLCTNQTPEKTETNREAGFCIYLVVPLFGQGPEAPAATRAFIFYTLQGCTHGVR